MSWITTGALVLCAWNAAAAPPLSSVHAHLDTKDQCDSCHVSFSGVPDSKCADCHQDIATRVRASRGYHGRVAKNNQCHDCHREHLGRNYNITPLDKQTFDHELTGWSLTGGHLRVPCRECHSEKRPKTRRDSYLNAPTDCQGCHGEYHGQASKTDLADCERCHTTEGWNKISPQMAFDHRRETQFPLTGQHQDVACDKCHLGKRQFGPIEVSGCVTCHQDPHPRGVFDGLICEDCHVTDGFTVKNIFDHRTTGWPLRGKHAQNACMDCHNWDKWKPPSTDCGSCHQDSHRGQFNGVACSQCHSETGWTGRHLVFNHDRMSVFPLKGKHRRVECAECHPNGLYKPIDTRCINCHADENPHGDTFGETPCSNCHSPVDWKKTRFDHSVTGFELEGRHTDQPCYRCHPNGTELQDDTQPNCSYCHLDVHSQQFSDRECSECHTGAQAWLIPFFDHSLSRFKLEGRHLDVSCSGCHKDGHYRPIEATCENCHANFHAPQFEKACQECHTAAGWSPVLDFDHNRQTQYPLLGAHERLACSDCHVNNQYVGLPMTCDGCHTDVHEGRRGDECNRCHTVNDWTVNTAQNHDFGPFRLEGAHDRLACERCHGPDRDQELAGRGPECVNCHRDPHFGSFGPQCFECHTQDYFLPSTFLHMQTGFRLSGAHRFVPCRDCHPGRVYGGLPNDCGFCHRDTFAATAGSTRCDHPRCIAGSLDTCDNCHRTTSWIPARPGVGCGICGPER
ncbi:MAG: hypothetical protein VX589_08565 [Myxococcota bacterium]|nr:hypothetical protein [Myxococcota bacterium]